MSKITEEEIKKILPQNGPSFDEVKNYLEKYNDEYIVIKCGGSVLINKDLFNKIVEEVTPKTNKFSEEDLMFIIGGEKNG